MSDQKDDKPVYEIFADFVQFPLEIDWSGRETFDSTIGRRFVSPTFPFTNSDFGFIVSYIPENEWFGVYVHCPHVFLDFLKETEVSIEVSLFDEGGNILETLSCKWGAGVYIVDSWGFIHFYESDLSKSNHYMKIVLLADKPYEPRT